ncbi:zinc chelation protein SecC [Paenibacillus sp. CCS19]|uniref:SEC-C metal-binding domain-containing protein n=1 Tax=Paenibacillus sp. CCS19 TaxID=3158387 RepID=UPI00255D182E|nr:SEC-C metal-binding domain-containing protein [Paenibacillus cellulosilyticus]GMK42389.1 zinc chelation protein SecC [Paenibacillus cellulosilyticus]
MNLAQELEKLNIKHAIKGEVTTELRNILLKLTKERLSELASSYNVPGRSKMNKSELADALMERIADGNEVSIAFQVARPNDWELATRLLQVPYLHDDGIVPGQYVSLMNRGMLFSFYSDEKLTYLIPSEIQEAYRQLPFSEFMDSRDRCQLVSQYIDACVNLYGVCSIGTVYEIYLAQHTSDESMTPEEFAGSAKLLMSDQQTWFFEDGKFISEGVDGEEELESLLNGFESKPHYIPDKELFLKYADNLYYEWTPQLEGLKSYLLKSFPKHKALMDDLVDDIQLVCSMDEPLDEVIYELERRELEFNTEAQFEQFIKLVIEVKNNTRLWANQGYTPNEFSQLFGERKPSSASAVKVGRNDPCPCGSGKKYKKCCM